MTIGLPEIAIWSPRVEAIREPGTIGSRSEVFAKDRAATKFHPPKSTFEVLNVPERANTRFWARLYPPVQPHDR